MTPWRGYLYIAVKHTNSIHLLLRVAYDIRNLDILTRDDVSEEAKAEAKANYFDSKEAVDLLREYLTLAVRDGTAEVICGWSGWVNPEHDAPIQVSLDYFGGDTFGFESDQYFIVSQSGEA